MKELAKVAGEDAIAWADWLDFERALLKGNSEDPLCGFSQKVDDILKDEKVKFKTFDISSNNEVREGLKKLF